LFSQDKEEAQVLLTKVIVTNLMQIILTDTHV